MEFQLSSAYKSFGTRTILDGISFELSTGEIMGIFGRNGCGKSTLLKAIFGTLKAKVAMQMDGREISSRDMLRSGLFAYLPQHPFIPPELRVRDIIPIYHPEEQKQDAIFYDPLIARIAAQKVGALSHGERKYLETLLIGNLSHPFMMLDEPFSMLEPLHIEEIKAHIKGFGQEKGIIITDHYYRDVWEIANKNSVMKEGLLFPVSELDELSKYEYLSRK